MSEITDIPYLGNDTDFQAFTIRRDVERRPDGEIISTEPVIRLLESTLADAETIAAYTGYDQVGRIYALRTYVGYAVQCLPAKFKEDIILEGVPMPELIETPTGEPYFAYKDIDDTELAYELTLRINASYFKNQDVEAAIIQAAMYVHYVKGFNILSERQAKLLHFSYLDAIDTIAERDEVAKLKEGKAAYYHKVIEDNFLDNDTRIAYLRHLDSLRYTLVDPIRLSAARIRSDEEPEEAEGFRIDTSELDNEPNIFWVAGTYSPASHTISMPVKSYGSSEFRRYLFHEFEHATSPNVRGNEQGYIKRLGFVIEAARRDDTYRVVMFTSLNEGFYDYRARRRLGLDPLSLEGSYPDNRQVVGRLVKMTGIEPWDDFYSPRSTFDKAYRQETYRRLTRALGAIAGPGFLNRLDTTWALYGHDYIIDILDNQVYSEITYTPIRKLREVYAKYNEGAVTYDLTIDDPEDFAAVRADPSFMKSFK